MSHTYAVLSVPSDIYGYIERKLQAAGYDHAFDYTPEGKAIDMHGIGLMIEPAPLDVAGQPKLRPTLIESVMTQVLNDTKSWLDDEGRSEFPVDLQIRIDAILLTFEQRRYK